jgi:two-component system phosphate regulon response regulator PhoB
METITVLLVEDEEDIREMVHFNLFKERYNVLLASDGKTAIDLAKEKAPDLIVLDLMIPKMDGFEVSAALKKNPNTKRIPIIMLTAKGEEEDIIKGLEVGADDYMTKPFSPKILLARIKAVLRRSKVSQLNHKNIFRLHDLKIDLSKRQTFIKNKEINLTFTEFQVLHLLAQKSGWVFTRGQIVDSIRGENHAITNRSVDVQIVNLRKKMGQNGSLIETVRGVGYRFKEK